MSKARSTLFPNGASNADPNSFEGLSNLRFDDPSKFIAYWNDFHTYLASEWTVTEVGVATQALTDALGGALLVTNAAADNNSSFQQLVGEAFQYAADKELWFKSKFQVSDATQSDVVMGLQITDTTPLAVSDGIFFRKDDGAATVDLVIVKNGTETVLSAVATLADATDIELAFHYDGVGTIRAYADDSEVASTTTLTNAPDDELLTVSFGVQNGEAVAKTMTVDYILAALER